jgi:hypothetical protein
MDTIQNYTTPSGITGIPPIPHITHVVQALWERTADRLTPTELEWFSGASEVASQALENLENVIGGIASYISADIYIEGEGANSANVGRFQSAEDVSTLLFFLTESVGHVRALTMVSEAASRRLGK